MILRQRSLLPIRWCINVVGEYDNSSWPARICAEVKIRQDAEPVRVDLMSLFPEHPRPHAPSLPLWQPYLSTMHLVWPTVRMRRQSV